MITTTLNRIRAQSSRGMDPRQNPLEGFCKLRAGLGPDFDPDAPIPYSTIARINGLDDALWCCRAEPQHARVWRLLAVWYARQVEHLMKDRRSRGALDVAERHANGLASDEELAAAWAAARAAARDAARDATRDATRDAARDAAWDATRDAAWDAAWDAARDATRDAARAAASAAAGDASWTAARDAQLARFIEVVDAETMEETS